MALWRSWRIRAVVMVCACCLSMAAFARVDGVGVNAATLQRLEDMFGADALRRLREWSSLLDALSQAPLEEKINRVNAYFNALAFVPDAEHWNQEDYWATPLEFIASNGGDCEDFAIAKYFTLQALGVQSERMRLAYVKALELNQSHMVLIYYPSPDSEPLVLDNLVDRIVPASRRKDLQPVYSFNAEGLWQARQKGQDMRLGTGDDVLLWKALIQRMNSQE